MSRGFLYLVAIMDWATRHVLSWRLSNTMDAGFCVEALNEALARYGRPEIFNTDQGQFTSLGFTGVLKDAGIAISNNIFIERLWRSLKYEAVHLHELTDASRPNGSSVAGSTSTTLSGPIPRWPAKRQLRPTAPSGLWVCRTRLTPCL